MFICLSPSVVLPASAMMFTDVSSYFCLSLHVVDLCLYPSLSPKRALLCLIVTPSLPSSSSRFISQVTICDLSRCQLCISTLPKLFWHRLSLYCRVDCADTTVLYGNKTMQHPGQALPLVDVCLSLIPRRGNYVIIDFF